MFRFISPELKDKAVCHSIVLALMLNNCKIDVSLLTESVSTKHTLENVHVRLNIYKIGISLCMYVCMSPHHG